MSMRRYKCLMQGDYQLNEFNLIPIRDEDKMSIMQWRNEQIDILRQKEPLTEKKQELYFRNVVEKLFEQEKPDQLLFSFLENGNLIGYGGLVHIDWESKNAEISFLTATTRNTDRTQFINDWKTYLIILKKIAFLHLDFIKIYTYSYDIRPNLYQALLESGFTEEATLKNHICIKNKLQNVLIHSYFFDLISFRMANRDDVELYFKWANDSEVRNNSFNSAPLVYNEHCEWFFSKLLNPKCYFYLFFNSVNKAVGQVRIENTGNETVIGISVDQLYRKKLLSSKMLIKATDDYLHAHPDEKIVAYIKQENIASYKSFINAGFTDCEIVNFKEIKSYKLFKKHD